MIYKQRKFNKVKDAFTDLIEGKIHRFELNKGDIITVAEKIFLMIFINIYSFINIYNGFRLLNEKNL